MLILTILGALLLIPFTGALTALDYIYHGESKWHSNSLIPMRHSEGLPPLVYMQISEDTYRETCQLCETGFMNYKFSELLVHDNQTNGFFGRTYLVTNKDSKYSQVIISFRGSDDLSDLFQDILLIVHSKTSQFQSSEIYFEEAYSRFSGDYEVSLTGHSLGGCFAYVEARKSGNMAVLFDNPGCEHALPAGNWSDSCPLITQYVKNPNLINNLDYSYFCGETFRIAPCGVVDNYRWLDFWRSHSYNIHVAMVLGSFFSVNPMLFLAKSAVFYILEREISSVLQGHLLMDYTKLFDQKTGAPYLFEKVSHESWKSYFSGYSCMLKAEEIKQELEFSTDPFFNTPHVDIPEVLDEDESHDYYEGFSYEFDWFMEDFPLLVLIFILHAICSIIPKLKLKHRVGKKNLPPTPWLGMFNYDDMDECSPYLSLIQKLKTIPQSFFTRTADFVLGDKSATKIKKSGRIVRETLKITLI